MKPKSGAGIAVFGFSMCYAACLLATVYNVGRKDYDAATMYAGFAFYCLAVVQVAWRDWIDEGETPPQ